MPDATDRMHAAQVRAVDAHVRLRRRAQQLDEVIEEVTAPHGIPVAELSGEDSMVVAVDAARVATAAVAANGKRG